MKKLLPTALLALAAAGLPGCSPDDAPPRAAPAAQPQAKAPVASKDPYAPLMQAVFGDDYLPAKGYAIEGGAAADVSPAQDGDMPLVLTATTSAALPSGDTALVVEGSFRRPTGEEMLGEVEGSPVHLFLLRQRDGVWHVVRRHENIAEKSRNGTDIRWVTLGPGKPGLAIENHWLGQGYTATWLSLYDPAGERMANLLGDSLMTRSDNEGACEDECWSGEAKWRLEAGSGRARNAPYDDLVLEITGEETLQPGDGAQADTDEAPPPAPETGKSPQPAGDGATVAAKRSLAGTARYAYRDGKYQLVEGTNTLPTF
ncbi:hypothetical protein [Massilia sp. METH4]|uniref:hypothetical protein n=1 Tax=Massilia sp. METH4 TaxID=3123041 RepID=UPI0030D04654